MHVNYYYKAYIYSSDYKHQETLIDDDDDDELYINFVHCVRLRFRFIIIIIYFAVAIVT